MAVQNSTLNQYEVLNYFNYKDGILYKRFQNKPMGSIQKEGYIVVGFNKKTQFAHRVIFLMFNGYLPDCIDHIDGDKSNNRIENLRPANAKTNGYNQKVRENTTSGIKNVTWQENGKVWQVRIMANKKLIYGGSFKKLEDAKIAADHLRKIHHKEFARG